MTVFFQLKISLVLHYTLVWFVSLKSWNNLTFHFSLYSLQRILDLTFGAGGHSKALLDTIPDCQIIALDRDPLAYGLAEELAEKRFAQFFFKFLAFDFLSVLRGQWPPTSKVFLSQILSITFILILEKEPVFSLLNVQC